MSALFLYSEHVTLREKKSNKSKCQVEVVDNEGIPELRIGPIGEAHKGQTIQFEVGEQFQEFVKSVNDLYNRISPSN
ncbi:phage protein [Desulfoluna limicola]|uniref:Phage protein n=1 Tax=Desulfoluna limicola TaxID=2810562 RepID=A0ABM7PHN7_9BACT|nr:hypothetical protein [Desulfoluna limicola]BCS96654.1 phage protein [Desulfoluna limicola]